MRTESLTVKNGRGSGGFGVDDKYRKRRTQTKEERLRQALMMFAAALVLLCYTWSTLMSIPDTIDQAAAFRASRKGLPARRQREEKPDDERQRRKKEQKTNNERGGMFKNWFGNDDRITTLKQELEELDQRVVQNTNAGIRWSRPELLPAMSAADKPLLDVDARERRKRRGNRDGFFGVKRMRAPTAMAWETEKQKMNLEKGPTVDFTQHSYEYPEKLQELPELGTYPQLVSMRELMDTWPQDDIDHPPSTIKERLIHFDYLNPLDLEAARKFRDAKLPFKLINVPEVIAAGEKWTDEYVALNFDGGAANGKHRYPLAKGTCQESPDNFFAFFAQGGWPVETMGIPPTRNNDLTYAKWAEHARYADASSLHANMPHLYYQAGVDKEERHMDPSQWTFISRDLPSFSSPSETFFVFEPESQKGIQCRFGERGVTAATHFDSGRNMVAMISGAKRYILSPPKECTKLGIITGRGNPVFRHSLLNFGHLNEIDNPEMPSEEREWLERSGDAMALDTVLKAGEVLYIPSHWFHYITSLQKSAQCNVRSGIDIEGDAYFGGNAEVTHMCEPR